MLTNNSKICKGNSPLSTKNTTTIWSLILAPKIPLHRPLCNDCTIHSRHFLNLLLNKFSRLLLLLEAFLLPSGKSSQPMKPETTSFLAKLNFPLEAPTQPPRKIIRPPLLTLSELEISSRNLLLISLMLLLPSGSNSFG